MKKRRRKPKMSSKGLRPFPSGRRRHLRDDRAQVVKQLAAAGLSGDVIAATLELGKNRLRAAHALDLHSGRTAKNEAAKAAAAAAPSKEDAEQLDRIKWSFESHWYDPVHGNDLYGGAHTIEQALQWCANFRSAREPNEDSNEPHDP